MKNIGKSIALAAAVTALLLAAVTACDSGYDCTLNNTSYNNIGFYSADTKERYPYPDALDISLMVNGKDSIMIYHIIDAESISLPMSYTHDTDTVVFHYESGHSDSLYIEHNNEPYYQSMECGTLMFHKIEEVRHTDVWIDSVAIKHKNVNFKGNENIKIYFYQ